MAANSSSVPRRMLRNNGMSPMPSGSKRITSSVTPGRMVGLFMPTTPRQLEKPITDFLVGGKPSLARQRRLRAVILRRPRCRDISLGYIAGKRSAIAPVGIAIAAAACALQQKALALLHLVASRRHRGFPRGAEAGDEARSASRFAASVAGGREAALVVAANDSRAF